VALLILFLVGVVRMLADIVVRAIAIALVRGCGWWLIGAFWGTLFHMAVAPVQWAMARGHTVGKTIGYQMDAEAARAADRDPEAQRLNPGDHTFRHIERRNTTNEIRGRTDCCEELAGQTVKRNQLSMIVVVLLSNYLKCVQ
jgi:hypothetical protein